MSITKIEKIINFNNFACISLVYIYMNEVHAHAPTWDKWFLKEADWQ